MARFCFAVLLSLGSIVRFASAWPIAEIMRGNTIDTNFLNSETSRRHFVLASAFSVALIPSRAQASPKVSEALEEMRESKEKLQAIPDLLEEKEWDKVRTILKLPPVNKLWNLGDSQNTVLVLAKETGNIDLFELKDELAYNLQICDQLTYDNAFVYFQPGNGKVKIKEPQQLAVMAMKQIQQIIDLASSE